MALRVLLGGFSCNATILPISSYVNDSSRFRLPLGLMTTLVLPAREIKIVDESPLAVPSNKNVDFHGLVSLIQSTEQSCTQSAAKAVNAIITVRSWLIGYHIIVYEQQGFDRAAYGTRLIEELSQRLHQIGVPRVEPRDLRRYRQFALLYPQIRESVTAKFPNLLHDKTLSLPSAIWQSATAKSGNELISSLSFTHFCELLRCESDEQRAFYEDECIRGCWSVRELKRQINSLLYERSELSIDKQKLREQTSVHVETASPRLVIRDPYVFEFLGLKPQEVMSESTLEDELLNKLQEFLMELGNGFCFEARQRRILIGDNPDIWKTLSPIGGQTR